MCYVQVLHTKEWRRSWNFIPRTKELLCIETLSSRMIFGILHKLVYIYKILVLATNVETNDDGPDTRLTLVVQLYNRKVIVWNERKSEKEGQTKI